MNKKLVTLLFVILTLMVVIIFGWWFLYLRRPQPLLEPTTSVTTESENIYSERKALNPTEGKAELVKLYFLDRKTEYLNEVLQKVPLPDNPLEKIKQIVTLLLAPIDNKNLCSVLPMGTKVISVYYDSKEQTVYIDFSKEICDYHPGGVRAEWATIYAIVNTICNINPREYKKVQFLVEGEIRSTLAGNWDISKPFLPNMTWVREL